MPRLNPGRKTIAGRSIRWDEEHANTAYSQGHWVRETLADALSRAAMEQPNRVLIVDGELSLDAHSLHTQAKQLATALLARYPQGSVISFMLPNWHEAAIIYMATTLAGMIAHPLLPSLRDHELRFILEDVESRMLFIPCEYRRHNCVKMLAELVPQLNAPPQVVVLRGDRGDHLAYDSLFQDIVPYPLPTLNPDAVRLIMYTSGTTGSPKGVMHSHNSIHALIRQIGMSWLVEPGDTFLVASPVSHIGGSIYAFECPLLLGTTAVLMEQWDADTAVSHLVNERCSHFAGATPFLVQILAAGRRAKTRLPHLKLFVCGGASVPPPLVREAADYFERAVVTRVYGSTEVPVTTIGVTEASDIAHAATTDGQTGIATIKLAGNSGTSAARGEVLALGPQMLVGYVHPEEEEGVFDADGYYRTGDLGQWVDDDYLLIVGRIKDIIIRNGENIAPREVEDLLMEHPDVAEIAIVGLPDPETGERACAVIVPYTSSRPDLASLREFLNSRGLARFKAPERLEMWAALPKNDAGKVLKHQIVAELKKTAS